MAEATAQGLDLTRQPAAGDGGASIVAVRLEHGGNAPFVPTATPRISWEVASATRGWQQSACELEARTAGGAVEQTGVVRSGASVLVPWPFAPLRSRERREVRVRAHDQHGSASTWSAWWPVEAPLLAAGDWAAGFVTPGWDDDLARPDACPYLRRGFEVRGEVAGARLYVTALGVYEALLNGEVVGDHVLAPGWTSYDHRLRYQTFDVTRMLRAGANALGAILGDGWYRGRLGPHGGRRNIYGERLALLAQLEIRYADGSSDVIVSDGSWRASRGPLLASCLYDGETYDARLEQPGWASAGFDDGAWGGVRPLERSLETLFAASSPPVRRIEELAPVSITPSGPGRAIADFGQNLVGRLRIRVQGPAGRTVTLRHAEVLEHGELCVRPLRQAAATDAYTLRGGGLEVWQPRFTFHGFRYAEVDGWPGELDPDDIRAVVCHSDLERTGWFECSDPLVERLHENVVWSMRGNFLDVPTDCAQRDERLGWTGDIQVFAPTALFLYGTAGFLVSWLEDLAAEQDGTGRVPNVVPEVLHGLLLGSENHAAPAAAWGDAAVLVPWAVFQRTGDLDVLERQLPSMQAWVELVRRLAGEDLLWNQGFQYGDWLDPSAPPERPARGRTDPALVATAYFARSAEVLGLACRALGRAGEAGRYVALAAAVRAAFDAEFLTPSGRAVSDSATAYALALQFALLPQEQRRRRAGERLVELVRQAGHRITTGFVGTPLMCDALCAVGAEEDAYRLLLERGCPSWLYPLTMGATTIWERWDSLLPDGSVNPGEMTSFNHYALGAVADWLHRCVAGLAPGTPGYRRIVVRPRPGAGLDSARARHRTPYGIAVAGWRRSEGGIDVEAVVPPNTFAEVWLPGAAAPLEVGSGSYSWHVDGA